jgi:hypothetical protein
MKDNQYKESARLGIFYDIDGIDPIKAELFAKTYRIVGVLVVVLFVTWGLSYGLDYNGTTPFQALARALGATYRNSAIYSLLIGALAFFAGYYYRFYIGNLILLKIFKLWDILMSIFRKI